MPRLDNESYSEYYNRLKKCGVQPVLKPYVPQQTCEEYYKEIDDNMIPGVEKGRYMVSNYGNVYDAKLNKEKRYSIDKDGYKRVSIKAANKYYKPPIHRLELMAFNPIDNYDKMQVNHINGDHGNNSLNNLEWCTPIDNSCHAMLYGLHNMSGIENPNNKLTKNQVEEICKLIQSRQFYDTEIAKMYNVSYSNITDIHNGKLWKEISKRYDISMKKPRQLTEAQVREICEYLSSGKYSLKKIAEIYNTTSANIRSIKNKLSWRWVSKDYLI